MNYSVIVTVSLPTDDRKVAEQLAKRIYGGIWDVMPEYPMPDTTVMLLEGLRPVHKIDRSGHVEIIT